MSWLDDLLGELGAVPPEDKKADAGVPFAVRPESAVIQIPNAQALSCNISIIQLESLYFKTAVLSQRCFGFAIIPSLTTIGAEIDITCDGGTFNNVTSGCVVPVKSEALVVSSKLHYEHFGQIAIAQFLIPDPPIIASMMLGDNLPWRGLVGSSIYGLVGAATRRLREPVNGRTGCITQLVNRANGPGSGWNFGAPVGPKGIAKINLIAAETPDYYTTGNIYHWLSYPMSVASVLCDGDPTVYPTDYVTDLQWQVGQFGPTAITPATNMYQVYNLPRGSRYFPEVRDATGGGTSIKMYVYVEMI